MSTSPRHIILLSDGTGNSRGKLEQTNVWRTYEALDLKDPAQPQTPRQFAFYDDGVGTSSFKPLALLGGAVGYGLARNVLDLYETLCRTYRDGDQVYAFGFSRGAFTIRVLIGLISHQGLMPYRGDQAELRRLCLAALRAYRRERYKLPLNWIEGPRALRDAALDVWARLRGQRRHATVAQQRMINIRFVGLWDTVAAYGMPVDEIATFINTVVYPLEMPDARLSPRVMQAAHALALDDERYTFHPKLWLPEPRIQQVWFAGMHSDVGGGYADKGLAHVSLHWMLEQAQAAGLRLLPDVRSLQQALADENGPMNDSRRGLAGYYRYKPRTLPPQPVVHRSVLRRIRAGQDGYAPIVLPAGFLVMDFDGTVKPAAHWVPELDSPSAGGQAGAGMSGAESFRCGLDRAQNRVWLRRGVYFLTVLATLSLLLLPLLLAEAGAACTRSSCWLSPFVRGLQQLLPDMLAPSLTWYAANPDLFLALVALVGALLWLGGRLQLAIFDQMRRVWYGLPALRPISLTDPPRPARPGSAAGRAIAALRGSRHYQGLLRGLRHKLFPTLWGVALTGLALCLAMTLGFAIQDADGDFCRGGADSRPLSAPASGLLDPRQLCTATGITLVAGASYGIELQVTQPPEHCGSTAGGAWCDDSLDADWRGVTTTPLRHRLAWLLKRELRLPFFAPIARIAGEGSDVYALQPDPPQARPDLNRVLRSRIDARTSGELFLYVNDAVGPPGNPGLFYDNNRGLARYTVWPLRPKAAPQVAAAVASAPAR
ncbi:DUF2235 domain-containing protein [Aquabacterium sp. OR-4]|uniref:DUF2235 domain-containing protein n=1 Tax=Aquabacterium sp. OR-4 TaxID=2978127 RepID=UPI0021B38FC8|nr:DUF2235 domain-containing protein [Aquabacterium sp. OR-4]MDT7837931.1 DUF2235 domain-containing protein [Aquabacterium sp. OR-4]